MRRALALILVAASACTTPPPAIVPTSAPAGARAAILRVFVNEPGGKAVAAARVCVSTTRTAERCAEAGTEGTLELSLPRSPVFVRVEGPAAGPRYLTQQRVADLTTGDAALWVELAQRHRLGGTVRDAGGRAVADAQVCAHPVSAEPPTCEHSHPDGTYAVDVKAGIYRLEASGPAGGRLVPKWAVDGVSADDATVYDVRLADALGVDIVLAHGVVLRGTVTAAGHVVENAQVCLKTLAAPLPWDCERTGKDGRYAAMRVPGEYWLWIVPPDGVLLAPQWYPNGFRGVDAQPFVLTADTTLDYALRSEPVRVLTGTVRTAWGSPVSGVLVCADTAFTTGRICRETASTGRYAIALRPETYIVSVAAPAGTGFISEYWSRKRTWAEADEVSLVDGDRTLDLIARVGSTATGAVRDRRGVPVANATLNFMDERGAAAAVGTDLAGRFSAVVRAGHYRVEVFAPSAGRLLGRDVEVDVPLPDELVIELDDVSVR